MLRGDWVSSGPQASRPRCLRGTASTAGRWAVDTKPRLTRSAAASRALPARPRLRPRRPRASRLPWRLCRRPGAPAHPVAPAAPGTRPPRGHRGGERLPSPGPPRSQGGSPLPGVGPKEAARAPGLSWARATGPGSHSSVLSLSSVCCASRDWSRLAQIVGCSVIIFGHLAAAPSGVWWGLGEQETPGLAWPGTGRGEQGL